MIALFGLSIALPWLHFNCFVSLTLYGFTSPCPPQGLSQLILGLKERGDPRRRLSIYRGLDSLPRLTEPRFRVFTLHTSALSLSWRCTKGCQLHHWAGHPRCLTRKATTQFSRALLCISWLGGTLLAQINLNLAEVTVSSVTVLKKGNHDDNYPRSTWRKRQLPTP